MSEFLELADDGPAINVRGGPWSTPKAYFDANVKCGDLWNTNPHMPENLKWVRPVGCGASDWDVKRTFWYPRPGMQFEIKCNRCGRSSGVEVRMPRVDTE